MGVSTSDADPKFGRSLNEELERLEDEAAAAAAALANEYDVVDDDSEKDKDEPLTRAEKSFISV